MTIYFSCQLFVKMILKHQYRTKVPVTFLVRNIGCYGILLSVHDGMSYFYTNDRIYIIPDGSILLFDQYLHETTYVDP